MRVTENGYYREYKYPDHFYSDKEGDGFTLWIPFWKNILEPLKGKPNIDVLELGTHHGRASVWLLEEILTGENCHIDTVDIESERKTKDGEIVNVYDNLRPYMESHRCTFHKATTIEYFQNIGSKKYDLIYVDASHEIEDVLADAVSAYFALKPQGIIIFDDYGWGECHKAIDAFMAIFDRKIHSAVYRKWQVVIQKKCEVQHREGYELEGYWKEYANEETNVEKTLPLFIESKIEEIGQTIYAEELLHDIGFADIRAINEENRRKTARIVTSDISSFR